MLYMLNSTKPRGTGDPRRQGRRAQATMIEDLQGRSRTTAIGRPPAERRERFDGGTKSFGAAVPVEEG
jgi:hypothetical protein